MSEFTSADLQESATVGLTSLSDRPATSNVSLFSGKLSIDEELKLSNETFNETIYDFFKDKDLSPLSQLTTTPAFPTPHALVQFASKTYTDYKTGETDAEYETRLALPDGWKLLTTASNGSTANGYFGAAYWHPEHQQIVVAHRGTKPTNLGALWADLKGVLRNQYVQQMESASTFANKVVELLREVKREKGISFQVFLTGHTVGGWLAQVTTFTTEYLKTSSKIFLKSHIDQDCFHPHTVVFDSPGCKDMLLKLRNAYFARLDGGSIDLEHLDITSYLSGPSRINTCNAHVGTVYRIFPDVPEIVWLGKRTQSFRKAKDCRKKIVEIFDPETGQVYGDEQGHLKVQIVVEWPICSDLKRGEEYKKFLEWTKHLNNYHPDVKDVSFQVPSCNPIRYETKLYDERVNNLRIFSQEEKEFVQCYHWLRQWTEFYKPKKLFSVMEDKEAQEDAEKILQSFQIENETIHCTDPSELKALIPYVKRLLQLFPEIKEIGHRFWLCETNSCIQQINQSALDFNPDALRVREFLEDDQQHVLQLQMVDGDEWEGLIKVYQVLQKTGCLSAGQYTVLKLERLLSLNMLNLFRTLTQSIKAPYLVVVACEANQLLKVETKDMIRTFFETIVENPCFKVILTTRSADRGADFLHHIGGEIFGNGFVTRDEKLNWCDLTSSSQKKILQKSVKFQGIKISLNELMSAESPTAKFLPLGALLEGKELTIADPVPGANGYNISYYIGRTLRHQVIVKQETYSDTDVKDKHVFLASSKQEFKQLCQLYPKSNVHWLEKGKSGNLIWQQSQGSLETLRKYIDTDSSHTYTADDLDKLLEQAQHQRIMLISDTAGMGKSTVLTHLSKQIKQKFPAKWVVRIDLNDHTDALKALKQEQIDKEKAIKFVSEKVLKLTPGLELELLKQGCEQNQKLRTIIMLDGFDEISPFYKQTAIDLLQALRQTAVEQLWVTTRPHLRHELEDKLQQLSYTLGPFSEGNQIELLTKFWSLKAWFTEMNDKQKEESEKKIAIYATKLIKKLDNSISDKYREFTCIPLHTRMLAEAFDEEVMTFCQSAESTPELMFQLDLLGLYGRFIENKYDIYHEEELQVPVNNLAGIEQRETDLNNMRDDHQLLALKVLFTEEQVALFQDNEQCTFSAEQLSRFGIVLVSHDGKPHFIHRTFAEYYVADCLVNRLTEENNTSQQVQTFILKDIFMREEYQMIRAFIDGLLSRCKLSKQIFRPYKTTIDDLGIGDLLHRAEIEGNANITEFLSESVRTGGQTNTGSSLVQGQDKKGRTESYEAEMGGNVSGLEKLGEGAEGEQTSTKHKLSDTNKQEKTIWDVAGEWDNLHELKSVRKWVKENLTTEESKNNFLFATDSDGNTVWHWAAEWGKVDLLKVIWELAKENLTTEEIKNKLLLATDNKGNTAWHLALEWGQRDIVKKIWVWAKEKLTREELKYKLLLATDRSGNIAWNKAAQLGKLDILQKIWDLAKENLTTEEIKNKLLLAADRQGNIAWHLAAKRGELDVLQKIWELAKENLTTEEIKNKLLLPTDSDGNTVWHWAAEWGKLELLQKIWELAEENLTTEEIRNNMLLATDNKKKTAWHVAVEGGQVSILQKIWVWAKEKLTTEELKYNLLLAIDSDGNTGWQWAVKRGERDILHKIWEMAKWILTREEMKNKLLLATDIDGNTTWHWAAEWGKLDVLQEIWELAKENLTTEEIKNKLLLAMDHKGNTAWHMAVKWGRLDIVQKIWEFAKEKLTTDELKYKLLLATDRSGNTVWKNVAQLGKLDVLQKIWDLAKENLTTEEIKSKLLATDNNGNTSWQLAVEWGQLGNLQQIWEWAKEKLTTEELKYKFLLAIDSDGNTGWHWAVKRGELDLLQKMWELAKENLTIEEIKNKFLLATDSDGNTVWHLAAEWGNLDVLQKIWEMAKEILTTEEMKSKLLLATDIRGNTAWHVAVEWGQLDILQKIWDLAKEILTTDELKYKLFLATDRRGNTAWPMAEKWGNIEIVLKIWELAKQNLTTEEIKNKFLLARDNKGNTAWHLAVEWGGIDFLQNAWDWAKEKITTEDLKYNLLLATDSDGKTAWHKAAKRGELNVLQKIWEWAKENLTTEEIKNKLLLATDRSGNTAWNKAAKWGKLDILQKIWELAEETLTTEELKDRLLLATDNKGNTACHLAVERSQLDILQKIWEWAKEKLTTEELKYKLLLATDRRGNTAWHKAAKRGELDLLQKIWEWLKENITTEEIKNNLLLATDSDGNAVWHWAAEWGKTEVLQKIWELAEENLTKEEIKYNILVSENMGNTAWYLGAKCNKLYVLEEIRDWAKENLTAEELDNILLLATGNMESTA